VRAVIERDRSLYAADNISFEVGVDDFDTLPAADLLIAKDVLKHWPLATIHRFLAILPRYKFALITNCTTPRAHRFWNRRPPENYDIALADFRPLDIRRPPSTCLR